MNTEQNEFLQSLDGEDLTAQQAAQLLELGEIKGDTGAKPEDGSVPAASASDADDSTKTNVVAEVPNADDAKKEGEATPSTDAEVDPANTVILAKDGKHTIGYEKLVEAREATATAKAQLEAANQELAALRATVQKQADAGVDTTKIDNQVAAAQAAIDEGVDPEIFGDFSEGDLAKGIAKLIDLKVAQAVAPITAKLEPIQTKVQVDATTEHYRQIYEKHPDADSLVESQELAEWIASQPSFARTGYQAALEKGTTAEVIELFDAFKAATVKAPAAAAADPADLKAAAKDAIAKTAPVIPASLTDFPGGRAGAGTREEALAGMDSGTDLLVAMEKWTPEQIENYLNRNA